MTVYTKREAALGGCGDKWRRRENREDRTVLTGASYAVCRLSRENIKDLDNRR